MELSLKTPCGLIKLGGNEMILGEDRMKEHNPVLLDFLEYKVKVTP